MNLVRRLFPFRTCTIEIKDGERALARPCLLYHIKRCQGPCIQAVSKADYDAQIEQIELFLEGRQESVVQALSRRDAGRVRRAPTTSRPPAVRDKIRAIERTMESQKMAAFKRTELDMVGLARQDNQAAIQLFAIRGGKMIGRDVFLLDAAREAPDEEVLSSFLLQFYARATSSRPRSWCRCRCPTAPTWRRSWRAGAADRSRLAVPQRGEKRELMALAHATQRRRSRASRRAGWPTRARPSARLEELAVALGLPGPPLRIECYDISNVQGSDTVGSMVVFEEGRPRTGEYRRFKIKTVVGPNDFASHQEVLRRRFRRARGRRRGQRGGAPLGACPIS